LPAAFARYPKSTLVLLVVVCAIHFGVGASVGLSVDEAHYALYAQHLALSYFDHPPLVGWVQWPLVALAAPTAVLRLIPEALWLVSALLVYRLGERLQSTLIASDAAGSVVRHSSTGAWAVLVFALAPILHILGIGLLPDTLLMLWSLVVMGLTWDLMDEATAQKPGRWLALGLALGLAGLSKYTAIFTALSVAWCLWMAHGWRIFRNGWLWLTVLLALVVVSPVAIWNEQNHWISFAYQAQHGAGGGWQSLHFAQFMVVQLLVYGPLMLWGWAGFRRTAGTPQQHLLAFAVVPFVVLAAMSGGGTNLPHWTAPAWATLAPFAGLGLACVAILGLMLSAGVPLVTQEQGQGNTVSPSNPFADIYGWDQAGQRALSLAQQQGLSSVSVQNWTLASRLGWYARPLPVHVLEDRFDQFDLWAGGLPVGGSTLLVDWSQLAYTVPVGAHGFADCTQLDTLPVSRMGMPIARFKFYACRNWSGSPQPQLQGAAQ
jgi:4-amino-4-deoxy-L-arabinose transferase-like glycosyltransferase